jgi:hypothetical protein
MVCHPERSEGPVFLSPQRTEAADSFETLRIATLSHSNFAHGILAALKL